jgi:trimeric autotransporter adhesin
LIPEYGRNRKVHTRTCHGSGSANNYVGFTVNNQKKILVVMNTRHMVSLVLCVVLATLVLPAYGDGLQDVPVGGTVFVGEENLNLTGIPPGTSLSWYAGTQVIGRSAPSATITIGDNTSFYVSPSEFERRTGNWYIGNSEKIGFIVNNPTLTVSVYDQESLNDVTNNSVSTGDVLTFRIETNMNVIPAQRPGEEGFLTIRVRSPDGVMYTSLYQDETTLVSLTELSVNTMPWYWVPLEEGSEEGWSTGLKSPGQSRVYPLGDYSFWTESDLNGMKENYKDPSGNDFTGRTVSAVSTMTIISDDVQIEISNESVVRGDQFYVTITGKSNCAYYLWVADTSFMSGMAGNQPPNIILSQEGVMMDPKAGPWPIGHYEPDASTGTIQQDVAQYYGYDNVRGVMYYASVTLDRNGNRTVGFSTTQDTKDQRYTIRVERPEPYNPPKSDSGPNRKFKTDESGIAIKKGGVEVEGPSAVVRGARTYFLGEEITLSGTNSATNFTYLFITGPNLPSNGGQMTDPVSPVNPVEPETFARGEVIDKKWEYKWQTANLNLDTGAYTIFAVSNPVDKSMLADTGPCNPDIIYPSPCIPKRRSSGILYNTISVIIKKPFISARVSPSVVASGDSLYIRGIAAGQPEEGVAVWILGNNKFIYQDPGVNTDGSFEQEISPGETEKMAPGQYFAVVQHPMYNEIFDVWPSSSVAGYNNRDLVVGSYPVPGNTLFRLQGDGSLQGPDGADALVKALNNPRVDDIYTKLQFVVEIPQITILPVDEIQVGDQFTIAGTTNLAVDDTILVEITSSSFKPTRKTESGEFSGTSGTVTVRKGSGNLNRWSFPVNTATFRPDEYIVQVSGTTVNAQESARFNAVEFNPATHRAIIPYTEEMNESDSQDSDILPDVTTSGSDNATGKGGVTIGAKESKLACIIDAKPTSAISSQVTPAPVTNVTTTVLPLTTTVPTARPTIQPGFGAIFTMIGLGVVAYYVVRKPRRKT